MALKLVHEKEVKKVHTDVETEIVWIKIPGLVIAPPPPDFQAFHNLEWLSRAIKVLVCLVTELTRDFVASSSKISLH